jgi:hypothetical protein
MSFLRRFALLAAILLVSACGAEAPAPLARGTATEPLPALAWKVVGTWSGRGSAQLETFPIERQTWRVRWDTKNEAPAGSGTFYVTANSADSGRIMAEVVEATGVDHDVAYISDLPHRYYLVVTSKNVDWTVTAEEPMVQ